MTPLGWVLIGVAVFVVLGAVGVLVLQDRTSRALRRKAKEAEPEDAW